MTKTSPHIFFSNFPMLRDGVLNKDFLLAKRVSGVVTPYTEDLTKRRVGDKNYGYLVVDSFEKGIEAAKLFAETYASSQKIAIVFRYHGAADANGGGYMNMPGTKGADGKELQISPKTFEVFSNHMKEAMDANQEYNLEFYRNTYYKNSTDEEFSLVETHLKAMFGLMELGKALDGNDLVVFTHCNLGKGSSGATTALSLSNIMGNTKLFLNQGQTPAVWSLEVKNNAHQLMLDLPLNDVENGLGWLVARNGKVKLQNATSLKLKSSGKLTGWFNFKITDNKNPNAVKSQMNQVQKVANDKFPQ